ncbi:MAG: LysR family transcriptional regulator [Gammaproteobacteria bacterium]|jgi:DNA-binding transcriptional LysR family regulator|uniref:LysR family transcriptional regulator n=1 Tax=SAR86 cluster bacterium TaxID=2030880 RepID=A0A520MG23_9GAMM|nr:MAG: LysR family transcriptional regulator [SAR86 cluster bacterium]|tara:strand:+ start:1766 stop:2668 length:903 start_codon:yes stop_codon:yes gene_type:complete
MKISSFDLNLFVILNAIYTEGSLTKAAEVVGITQPAVSNALSRLRERFDDDLFIRTGSGMVPTQKTENIISDIQNALSLMQQSVNEPDTFDPKLSNRNFKLSLGDVSEGRVLPYIMNEIDKNAPFVSMGSYAYSRSDQVHALATHNLDFVVDPIIPASEEINSYKVFEDDFVAIHRDDHPLGKIDEVSVDDILAQRHLHVSNRKRGLHLIDVELDKIGYRREIALRCQHFLIAPRIIRSTDLVLMGTRSFAKSHNLQFIEIPTEIPSIEYHLIWHKSDEGDGGHLWMKDLIIEAFVDAKK